MNVQQGVIAEKAVLKLNPAGQSTAKQNGLATIPNKIVNLSNNNIVKIKMISITDI